MMQRHTKQTPAKVPKCRYCDVTGAENLCRCLHCQELFCNSSAQGEASHIARHLLCRRHLENGILIDKPNSSKWPRKLIPECRKCGTRNPLKLHLVSGNTDFICRDCDLNLKHLIPVFRHDVLHQKFLNPRRLGSDLTRAEVRRIEYPDAPEEEQEELDLPQLLSAYPQPAEYAKRMRTHLSAMKQAVIGRMQRQTLTVKGTLMPMTPAADADTDGEQPFILVARGDPGTLRALRKVFRVVIEDPSHQLYPLRGTLLYFGYSDEGDDDGLVRFDLSRNDSATAASYRSLHKFLVRPDFNETIHQRYIAAVEAMRPSAERLKSYLYLSLIGHTNKARQVLGSVPELPRTEKMNAILNSLDSTQQRAVIHALQMPLSLIQGPPGTGKTTVSVAIVTLMCLAGERLLVCAPSNTATDHLASQLRRLGLNTVRVQARSRETLQLPDEDIQLHVLVDREIDKLPPTHRLRYLRRKRNADGWLPYAEFCEYTKLAQKIETRLLGQAQVVLTTCVTAGSKQFRGLEFPNVLIDEAAQAVEPETLIPLTHGAKKLALVGDHQQLGPLVFNAESELKGFGRSLFERLQEMQPDALVMLDKQYRMPPELSRFPSHQFYRGLLQDGVAAGDRPAPAGLDWPVRGNPKFFCHVPRGAEERGAAGKSYLNCLEIVAAARLAEQLCFADVAAADIGIICFYEAQRARLKGFLAHLQKTGSCGKDAKIENIEVANVDSFQGREKKYIILCCARSNPRGDVGFLCDARRLNVALTRAQYGLLIVGKATTLSADPLWHELLQSYKNEGVLGELVDSKMTPKPDIVLSAVRGGPDFTHSDELSEISIDNDGNSDFWA